MYFTSEAIKTDILLEVVPECCYILKVDLESLAQFYWFILEMNQIVLLHFLNH